jgi:hypothetical protein
MHPPIFVREPSDAERRQLEAGLRAANAFTVRRAQIVLLSAEGRRPREMALSGISCVSGHDGAKEPRHATTQRADDT